MESEQGLPDYLLQTKLYRPRIAAQLVPRPRLLEKLEQGAEQRLTLISAPAGYGKTTLVDAWLEQTERPYAWLSLDSQDNDLTVFALYLAAAVRMLHPTALPTTWALLNSAGLPETVRLADIFLQELAALDGPLWLVIDDYHVVQKIDIHEFMTRLVMNTPPTAHLVFISRSDPPFPLARLRTLGHLVELRAVDLRFDQREAGLLLRNEVQTAVAPEVAALLQERTEGWPAGLQLAAISLRDSAAPEAFAQRFAGSSNRLVSEYLVDEVLATLPEKQRRELLRSALPDRFCGPLFGVLTGAPEIDDPDQRYLESLWRANLFVVALDDEGVWYRYHAQFRMLLRQRLGQTETPQEVARMQRQAGQWFAGQGLFGEAFKHLLQGRDEAAALQLFEDHLADTLNKDDWRRLERWLSHFPPQDGEGPALLIARAYLHHYNFQHAAILPLVDAAEQALTADPAPGSAAQRQIYLGLINTLRAVVYRNTTGDREAELAYATAAIDLLPDAFAAVRSLAETTAVFVLQSMGRHEQALQMAESLLRRQPLQADVRSLRLLLNTCGLHYGNADLPALETTLPLFHRLAQQAQQPLSMCWALFGLGWHAYQTNDLPTAETYFSEALALRYEANGRAVIDAHTGLVMSRLALGRAQEAAAVIDDLRTFLHDRGLLDRLVIADALALRLALARSDYDPHWQSLASFTRDVPVQIVAGLWETPALTAVRAYLAQGGAQPLARAAELLATARAVAAEWHSPVQLIEIGALEALLHAARGDEAAALAALGTAVRLAEPGGTLRLITDAGPALQPLLRRLLAQNVAPAYGQRLLAVFPPETAAAAPGTDLALPLLPAGRQLSAALTNREIDVLLLLAERLTNKEIAARLSLSPNTVKKHSISLYEKLGVRTRRQAVARAQTLGLLPEGL